MSKEPVKRLTVHSRNVIHFRLLHRELNEWETFYKVLTDRDPSIHLGLVGETLGFRAHITYETTTSQSMKHKNCGFLSREDALRQYLWLFSRPGSPPPPISSVESKEEMDQVYAWLRRAAPKVVHPPRHRKILVFRKGPAKELVAKLLNSSLPGDIDLDIEELTNLADTSLHNPEIVQWVFEDETKPKALELGFLLRPFTVVMLSPNKSVVEFRWDSTKRWIKSLESCLA